MRCGEEDRKVRRQLRDDQHPHAELYDTAPGGSTIEVVRRPLDLAFVCEAHNKPLEQTGPAIPLPQFYTACLPPRGSAGHHETSSEKQHESFR
jgi:hypothetical protein